MKKIFLVEDNPIDVEFTMEALDEQSLANRVIVLQDGVKAMDYL